MPVQVDEEATIDAVAEAIGKTARIDVAEDETPAPSRVNRS
jgi:hypothetical protein